ncbi:hypothetical protein [Parasphingopyxis lamellibrachiae]
MCWQRRPMAALQQRNFELCS